MSFKLALTIGALVVLTGCNTVNQNIGSDDPAFGEAVRYNAALQIIDPDPVYPPGGAMPGDNGAKGVAAMKRYRTDAVKQVETMQTSAGSGSPR